MKDNNTTTSGGTQTTPNDSRVNIAYELETDNSIVVFMSLNYLTGAVEHYYQINKGVHEFANTMIMQNIMSAAAMDSTATSNLLRSFQQ